MLRLSVGDSEEAVDIRVVNGQGDGGVALGGELRELAEAIASRDTSQLTHAREQLVARAGSDVMVDAVAVAANFQRMVRIADSTGIPLDGVMDALSGNIQDELDLRRFHSAANTPRRGPLHGVKAWMAKNLSKIMLKRASR